jgi:hypothetical protein
MKRRFLLFMGGVALSVCAVLATKANKKFAAIVTTAYYNAGTVSSPNYQPVWTKASGTAPNAVLTSGLYTAVLQGGTVQKNLYYEKSGSYFLAMENL